MEPRTLTATLALLTFISQGLAGGLHFTVEPESVVVEQGSPARLDCQAESKFGQPSIQWRTDDGQAIAFIGDSYRSQLANGSLYINSVDASSPESTGNYQCLATIDNVGAIVSRAASVRLASLPGFEKEPQDTMVYPGQIAYLSCSLPSSYSLIKIQWLKDEHPLLLDETRMTILPSGALEIDDVQIQDVGSYRCNASGYGQYRLSNKAQLGLLATDIDQDATAPVFIAKPLDTLATEGSSVTLECAANGYPKPTIFWLKDGIAINLIAFDSRYKKTAASSLLITNVIEEDYGLYQCRAENEVDTLDATAEVVVQVPPRFIKKPQDKIATESQDLEFECEIYGKPEPKVTWLKNGERITLNPSYWQIVNGNNLRINGLISIDAGIFQCIGENPAGSVQASARLTINQPKKEKHKNTTPKLAPKKKLLHHRPLYNNTWQHPSTLLGHTLSAFTPNPPLSISPSDDPADLPGSVRFPNSHYDPESPFIDDTDSLDSMEGSVPSAPRNLTLVIANARFVTLRWQEPENANGDKLSYYIYYKQESNQRERKVPIEDKLEAIIPGLQPSMTYQFRVVARNSRGPGASSEVLQVVTQAEANVPGPPLNLVGQATSSMSIALSWEEPNVLNGRISKYIITFTKEDSEERTRETTSTMYELVDLVPYTVYNIRVQAANENGPGAFTRDIAVRTHSSQPTDPPHNVTLEAASSTSVIVRWEPPLEGQNGIITGYKIRYRRQDRGPPHPNTITTEGNQRLYVLSDLDKHVLYQVRVCAFNANGTGPWSEWMTIETYENDLDETRVPNSPTNLRLKIMSNSITVWWSPPKDQSIKVRGYKLGWGKGIPDVHVQMLDGKQRSYTIENLEPSSEYVISITATNEAGEGAQLLTNVRTSERSASEAVTPMIPPVGLKAIVSSATTVVLYWTDSSLSKSQYVTDNRYYRVRYTYNHHSSNPRYKYHNASDLNCMIDDLKPNTQYEFTVKVVKGRRESPWSMVVLNQTQEAKPSSPPRDLTVQIIEDRPTSLLLRWQPPKTPNGPITGYIIFYSTDNAKFDRDWKTEGIIGDKTEYTLKSLQPSTTYYFKIQARNSKGNGPFSTPVTFKTLPSNGMDSYDELHDRDGRGFNTILIYIIVGCSIVLITGIAVVVVVLCCKRNPDSPDRKKGYMKECNQKTQIKPPDLWIHHDQMELKALEKSSLNGEASTSGVNSNTLPRSGNPDYSQENTHNSSSLDKRTYVPSYMGNTDEKCSTLSRRHNPGSHKPKLISLPVDSPPLHQPIATATPIVNSSMSQPAIHSSCTDMPSIRQNYPRTVAQYSLSRAHITLEPTPESSPESCTLPSSYEPLQSQLSYGTSGQPYSGSGQYAPNHYGTNPQQANNSTGLEAAGSKRLQGHPLKSFSVPAPPPQSAPSTPAQQKHGVRPTMSGSPYKKPQNSTTQLAKNRLASVSNPQHTSEEVERLKPSYSTEELNQEMANLEGLMKDLNAITASEFEC